MTGFLGVSLVCNLPCTSTCTTRRDVGACEWNLHYFRGRHVYKLRPLHLENHKAIEQYFHSCIHEIFLKHIMFFNLLNIDNQPAFLCSILVDHLIYAFIIVFKTYADGIWYPHISTIDVGR